MVLMTDIQKYPLQTYLMSQLQNLSSLTNTVSMDPTLFKYLSERSLRGAQIILTTIPILLLYPFLQRYFVQGLILGSVKG
jgi:putative aldouronate transport system permease protein